MATIHELAKAAGVSIATISRAFSDDAHISTATKERIRELARQMDYNPKTYHKRQSSGRKHETIGVIIACRNYPWFNTIMSGICDVMEAANITPVFTDTNETPYREIICMDKLKSFVSGLLVVSSTELNEYSKQFLTEINKTIPIVTLIRNTNLERIDSVGIDCFHQTCAALNLMIDNGHRHIAIINGPMVIKPSLDRFAGYIEVLRNRSIPIRNEYIYYSDFNEANAFDIAVKLIRANPLVTAIFSSNTVITRGCLKAFEHCGVKIPDDMAFISYGDDYSFSMKSINITVISDPNYEIGSKAATLLLDRLNEKPLSRNKEPKRIIMSPDLILRGSEVFPANRKHLRE